MSVAEHSNPKPSQEKPMTLQEHNQACRLQRQMKESGKHEDFCNVFTKCLPNHFTESVDPTALDVFTAWALIHPDLQEALAFVNDVLNHRPAKVGLEKLCG
jgi:hypothetical protein